MHCDVLVIGAGPAGSALGGALARRGFAVAIADHRAFPRPKPCGEFLSPQCEPLVRELGLAPPFAALGPCLVRGMHLHGGAVRALGRFRRVGDREVHALRGFGVRRERFDAVLLEGARAAGAQWLPRHAFGGLVRGGDGAVTGALLRAPDGAPLRCTARWVVGADGVHSAVARELGVRRPVRWLDRVALVAHFRGVPNAEFAEVHLLDDGFFAATSVDDGQWSLNLILPRARVRERTATDWDDFVAAAAAPAPGLAARLAGATRLAPWRGTGALANTTTRQTGDGVALVGDACGYVDPLTGEGIYLALAGARALAGAVTEALADPARWHRAMARYLAFRKREVVPRLRASLWLQRALRHPWLVRAFLRTAVRHPAVADLVVTLTGDTIHPRDLLSAAFWRDFRRAEVA